MTQLSYREVIEALRKDVGSRWFGPEAEGRAEMARALRDNLGFGREQADDMIQAMVDDGTLRYVHEHLAVGDDAPAETRATADNADPIDMIAAPVLPGGVVGGFPASGTTPVAAPIVPAEGYGGYWEVGSDSQDADSIGRKGQIQPR